MRKLIIFLISTSILSCNNQTTEIKNQNTLLKKENDSLKALLSKLEDKYVFDDIKVRVIPNEENTNRIGSDFNGEFVIIAYNNETEVNFSTEKENALNGFKDSESLKKDFGGFPFKLPLEKPENDIYFTFKTNGIYGKNHDGMIISDRKNAK
ncbi:hypothetical protein [Mangrovimonas sp. YM274]|uniref:hypothetical protein n=1 Tax=Mangrovimonas sp. YM274 TaxID=3070660 RepID=UPI0027DD3FE0|nr:hypothetical protein [Mangrovimonas sp. YM274]WMI68248.1 hypothetical protein RBH95_13995 [Mangrovimonas sp. YM274]